MNYNKSLKRILTIALTFVAFLLILLIVIKLPIGNDNRKVTLIIEEGSSVNKIASQLEDEKLIVLKELFLLRLIVSGKQNFLNAGKYIIQRPISIDGIMNLLISGKSEPRDINVTIPEGSTILEISQLLSDHNLDAGDNFINESFMNEEYSDLWILEDLEEGESLEGFLFPDTYGLLPEMTSSDIIRLMVENLQGKLSSTNLKTSSYIFENYKELIILSSIVQKESPLKDMNLIAGVFVNRLKIGKRLESDATVNYFLGTSKLIPNYKDITNENSYNTYLNSGLPSGAISNPGLNAIHASLSPDEHEYLFFLHTPDGETKLSKTYEKHLEYRKIYWE